MSPKKVIKRRTSAKQLQNRIQELTNRLIELEERAAAEPEPARLDADALPEVPEEGRPFRPAKVQRIPVETPKPNRAIGANVQDRIVIHPTPYVRSLFSRQRRGLGGFQSLHQALQDRMAGSKELVLTPSDFGRVINYAVNYGEGGFQQSLRWLVALWAAENLSPVITAQRIK